MAYTTADAIAAYLGTTLTAPQAAQADVIATAVTTFVDHRAGRSWQATGEIVAEQHQIAGNRIYLSHPPATAVAAVSVHPGEVGGIWTALAATAYELTDPPAGVVTVTNGYNGYFARVDYTSTASGAPEDLELAATILAAGFMTTSLHPESAGAESISVGQNDISVKYAGSSGQETAEVKAALAIVDSYRAVVLA